MLSKHSAHLGRGLRQFGLGQTVPYKVETKSIMWIILCVIYNVNIIMEDNQVINVKTVQLTDISVH